MRFSKAVVRWPPMGYWNGQDHNILSLVYLIQFHWMAVWNNYLFHRPKTFCQPWILKRTLLPNLRNRCLANDSDSWALNQSGSPLFAGGHRGLCVGVSDFLRNGKAIPRKMVGLFQKVAQHKWTSLLVGGRCFWLVFRPANFDDSSSYLRVGRCSPHSI